LVSAAYRAWAAVKLLSVDTALRELASEEAIGDPAMLLVEMAQLASGHPSGLTAIEESPGAPHARISVIAPTDVRRRRLRAVLACLMIGMGILHVAVPGPFVRIMPAALPVPLMLVLVSGFFEVLGGIGLLVRHLAFQAGRSGQGCRCKVCSSPGLCGWGPMGRGRRRVPEPRLELVGRARTLQGVGGHGDWPQWSWTLVDSAPGPGGHRAACFRASVQPNQIPSICT
jgi:hypothetical protein